MFQSLVGETLNKFVKRLRLERALYMLSHGPRESLTEIALACGFASSSDFSRSFKQRYGVPPSVFDLETHRARRRVELQAATDAAGAPTTIADAADDAGAGSPTRYRLERLPPGSNPDGFEVELRRLPARRVAYIRVLDSFRPGAVTGAAQRLVEWAEARGLAGGQWLGYMWDDPGIVALARSKNQYTPGLRCGISPGSNPNSRASATARA